MESKTKRNVLILASIFVLGGVGYYFWKKNKDKKAQEALDAQAVIDAANLAATVVTPGAIVTTGGGTTLTPNPFKTEADLMKFQQWVIFVKKDTSIFSGAGIHASMGDDGKWGGQSRTAWNKYGKEYITSGADKRVWNKYIYDGTTTTIDPEFETAKAYLLSVWKGNKNTFKTRLDSLNKYFVIRWAYEAKANNGTGSNKSNAFIWDNKLYNISMGDKILDFDPTLKNMAYGISNEFYFRKSPSKNSEGKIGYELKDKTIGKVTWYFWNDNEKILFFYIPTKLLGTVPELGYVASGNVYLK